jgi:uncharacterized protein (DUF3084 family)
MGVRAQLSWMAKGRAQVVPALDALSADLRALQAKVAELETSVNRLATAQASLDDRQLDELDRIRTAVASATDDLAERMTAVEARARSGS